MVSVPSRGSYLSNTREFTAEWYASKVSVPSRGSYLSNRWQHLEN